MIFYHNVFLASHRAGGTWWAVSMADRVRCGGKYTEKPPETHLISYAYASLIHITA